MLFKCTVHNSGVGTVERLGGPLRSKMLAPEAILHKIKHVTNHETTHCWGGQAPLFLLHCTTIWYNSSVILNSMYLMVMYPPPFSTQLTGKCGSVLVRLIPAPRGTSIVAAGVSKKLLTMAGVSDCYTSARGQTATLGNFGTLAT